MIASAIPPVIPPAPARLLRHPGPVARERFTVLSDETARSFGVRLPEGASLVDALVEAEEAGTGRDQRGSAAFAILHGSLAPCVYCLAVRDPSGARLVTYSPMRDAGTVSVQGGAATLGTGLDGKPLAHCHAWFVDPHDGRVAGGHFDTAATRVGPGGLVARMTLLGDLDIRQVPDAETNHAIFSPVGHLGGVQ